MDQYDFIVEGENEAYGVSRDTVATLTGHHRAVCLEVLRLAEEVQKLRGVNAQLAESLRLTGVENDRLRESAAPLVEKVEKGLRDEIVRRRRAEARVDELDHKLEGLRVFLRWFLNDDEGEDR